MMIQRPDTSVQTSYKYGLLLHETAPPPQRGSSSPRSVRAPCSLSHAMTATKPVPRSRPSCAPSRIRRIRRRTSSLSLLSVLSTSHFREEARRLIRTTLMTTIDGDADIQDTLSLSRWAYFRNLV